MGFRFQVSGFELKRLGFRVEGSRLGLGLRIWGIRRMVRVEDCTSPATNDAAPAIRPKEAWFRG